MAYRRSYEATDYSYQDPRGSFFGNVFRAVTGVVGGAVKGFLKGGPIGGIVGAVGGAVSATQANIAADAASPMNTPGGSPAGTPSVALARLPPPSAGPGGGIVTMSPVGTPVSAVGLAKQHALAGGAPMRGYHVSKHSGKVVKNRHMNWANHRALGRAERRIHSAVKHFSKYIKWVHPHRQGHAAPHFGRKKRAR
jgi:hypothetical protein